MRPDTQPTANEHQFPFPLIRARVVAVYVKYRWKRSYWGKSNKFGKYLDIKNVKEEKNPRERWDFEF